ncbi:hypothetical protein HMPREF3039_02815 [Akkermansia sp. KLE1798]|nr:hypothetical protein HMPREF3039_02815 [Akkermansia sp. KLE1798]
MKIVYRRVYLQKREKSGAPVYWLPDYWHPPDSSSSPDAKILKNNVCIRHRRPGVPGTPTLKRRGCRAGFPSHPPCRAHAGKKGSGSLPVPPRMESLLSVNS